MVLTTESKHSPVYPQVHWGKEEKYGLANILLVLIERNPRIQANLYPVAPNESRKVSAQCEELAIILFTNIPEINVHLRTHDGLWHYAISVMMRLRRWTDSFLSVIFQMPQSSTWPDREKIRLLCPRFARLAPLLWRFLKTRRRFRSPENAIAVQRTNLEFCSAITVYDPQRAAAQLSAQNAVLRQLEDPLRRNHNMAITAAMPALTVGKKRGKPSSQKDQENVAVADQGHLGKKQRCHGRFEELNPLEIPEKARRSNSKSDFLPEGYPNLHGDKEKTPDNLNTPTYAIPLPPQIIHNMVASAADSKEEFHPLHSLSQITKKMYASPPLPKISHVSSTQLFLARLQEADSPEKQDLDNAPPPPPALVLHHDKHEFARKFSTTTPQTALVHNTSDNNLCSTYSPRFFKKEEEENSNANANGAKSWLELDKARLKKWSQIAEKNNQKHNNRPDLDPFVKVEKQEN